MHRKYIYKQVPLDLCAETMTLTEFMAITEDAYRGAYVGVCVCVLFGGYRFLVSKYIYIYIYIPMNYPFSLTIPDPPRTRHTNPPQ